MTVQEILNLAEQQLKSAGIESARLDAEVLLARVLGLTRTQLHIHFDTELNSSQISNYIRVIHKRTERIPVAYLTGHKEFMGFNCVVTPEVLIPRPETELLVETAIDLARTLLEKHNKSTLTILDIGTGSGNIAISLAKYIPYAEIIAVDISESALIIARENAERNQVRDKIHFIASDLFSHAELKKRMFDIIVSNPPYIADTEIPELAPEITRYEPKIAYSGGPNGMQIIYRILTEAPLQLNPDGYLILEIGEKQAELIKKFIETNPRYALQSLRIIKDFAGKNRVVVLSKSEYRNANSETV
ncbi:MAG: peptide chain release factor N(5)-glutamine methyltransferase [bacterium]|nr:peptide chain release factor N(5)-glutamine methyltransferase [bacterium]